MTPRRQLRAPTSRDLSKLALARASSRLALDLARRAHSDAAVAAFRAEIGATIRQVSPFVTAALFGIGLTLDAVVEAMRPGVGWPDRPGVPAVSALLRAIAPAAAGSAPGSGPKPRPAYAVVSDLPGVDVGTSAGDYLHVYVLDHSIEAAGRMGRHWFDTCFGTLGVETQMRTGGKLRFEGRRLEDVLEVPASLRRGWIVENVSPSDDPLGVKLAVWTGVRRYRAPWQR